MPIRFVCEHCGQRLRVASRNAGRRAQCPKCTRGIRVPLPEVFSKTEGEAEDPTLRPAGTQSPGIETPAEGAPVDPPPALSAPPQIVFDEAEQSADGLDEAEETADGAYAQFAIYDDELPACEGPAKRRTSTGANHPQRVAIPRLLIYLQGLLLGLVALASFTLGLLMGNTTQPPASEADPQACRIEGRITYQSRDSGLQPDEGATVVILPQQARPETGGKLPDGPLRPDRQGNDERNLVVRAIRELGGDLDRANAEGHYSLQVPARGSYYLLVLSRNASAEGQEIQRRDLAQVGRYFTAADQLLTQYRYRWQGETIRRDQTLDFTF